MHRVNPFRKMSIRVVNAEWLSASGPGSRLETRVTGMLVCPPGRSETQPGRRDPGPSQTQAAARRHPTPLIHEGPADAARSARLLGASEDAPTFDSEIEDGVVDSDELLMN
jgi:hypothetical protein